MNAKEFLKQYEKAEERIRQLTQDIEDLVETIGSITGSDGQPRGTDTSDKTGNLAAKLADLKTYKEALLAVAWSKREEVAEVIAKVDNADHSRLLYAKYIELKSWREVADDLGRDEVYTRGRLHGAALENVRRILNEFTSN